jgi:hypothetical protein
MLLSNSGKEMGKTYYDQNGHLLHNSTGARSQIVDFGIPSTNLDATSSSWNTASTDIISPIQAIKQEAIKATGYPLKYAFYESTTLAYILKNDYVTKWMQTNASVANDVVNGQVPSNFCGLQWIDVTNAHFQNNSGTVRDWQGAGYITFAPDPQDVMENVEGSCVVPTSFSVSSLDNATAGQQEVFGASSYATPTFNPVGVECFVQDVYLPAMTVPGAFWKLVVSA